MQMIVGTNMFPNSLFVFLAPGIFLIRITDCITNIIITQQMLHYIIDLPGMHHQVNQASPLVITHSVTVEEIEYKTIRHNTFGMH